VHNVPPADEDLLVIIRRRGGWTVNRVRDPGEYVFDPLTSSKDHRGPAFWRCKGGWELDFDKCHSSPLDPGKLSSRFIPVEDAVDDGRPFHRIDIITSRLVAESLPSPC